MRHNSEDVQILLGRKEQEMTDHKFTDDEIIKALECCNECNCKQCPCFAEDVNGCKEIPTDQILALINRQKAEIERLKKIGDDKTSEVLRHDASIRELHKQLETAKSEAIKEFANCLLKKVFPYDGLDIDKRKYAINAGAVEKAIKDLVEEMTEDQK